MRGKTILGRAARPAASMTVAALLAGIVISGCGNNGTSTATTSSTGNGTASTARASSSATTGVLTSTSGSGTCYEWPGVGDLNAAAFPLREAAGDIETFGPGSDQANSDGMAVNVALTGLAGELNQLPYDWAQEIQNQVITPGYSEDPGQLSTAASNAESLATTISQLCYTP
jgi:hypothetical protein